MSTPTTTTATIPVITVGIAGGTGAGKTTIARKIYEKLGGEENVSYLVHDSYYKDLSHITNINERTRNNFDHPESLETSLLIQHIQLLKQGQTIQVPKYDFTTHTRIDSQYDTMRPKKIILIEGILIFTNIQLVQEMDIKIFVEAEPDIRLLRRLNRDVEERGRTIQDILQQYQDTVRPMHNQYVEPSKQCADIIIHSTKHSMDVATDMLLSHLKYKANIINIK